MKERIISVDAFRGAIIGLMILVNNPGTWSHAYAPLKHAVWHGCTLTDLVFPFFLFIVGISITLSYNPNKTKGWLFYKKILKRSLILYFLGWFLMAYTSSFPFIKEFYKWRLPGVLQRISIVFLVSSILYNNLSSKKLIVVFISSIIGYWFLMTQIPLFDGTIPTLDRGSNIAADIDLWVLKTNHLWKADYDPEGLVSTIPAIATCLFGVFLGQILISKNTQPNEKLKQFMIIGFSSVIMGYIWGQYFPLNKALWTSSFVLYTGGWGYIVFGVFYYYFDILKITFVKKPLIALGSNALIIFFLSGFIAKYFYIFKFSDETRIHQNLYRLVEMLSTDKNLTSLLYAILVLSFYLLLAYYLYKRKIFIRV